MKLRIACVALALALAPTLGLAAGCQHGKQAMSCAPGSSFDADAGTCVADATT
ncbi:MAG: hypothetical protein ACSHXB_06730 [Sulfitobacter sp.]